MSIIFLASFLFASIYSNVLAADPPYGQLSIEGKFLKGNNGQPVQLRGMSLFWSQWMAQFYNRETVKHIKNEWNSNVVRAAMGIEMGGYLENPDREYQKVKDVINAAIDEGIYVIVDWHDHHAEQHQQQAIDFFSKISREYSGHPNIIYEVYNEPNGPNWPTIKAYAEGVIDAIRQHDSSNIIIVGTENWSQFVDNAANDPINKPNVAYTLHFYAGTHKQDLRDRAQRALDKNVCLFVTEYGTVNADGGGNVDRNETKRWWEFLDLNRISYVNWAMDDKNEGSAALNPGTTAEQVGDGSKWTESGRFVNEKLRNMVRHEKKQRYFYNFEKF